MSRSWETNATTSFSIASRGVPVCSSASSSVMTATFSDASKIDFKLAYQPFFITGDLVADGSGGKILAGG